MGTYDAMWRELFAIEGQSQISLQAQLRSVVVRGVLERRLAPGASLPSSRRLSGILGISRNTVTLAYQALAEEGFLVASPRVGYAIHANALKNCAEAAGIAGTQAGSRPNWERRICRSWSSARHVAKPSDWFSYRYPFVYGQFDATLFPNTQWREVSQLAFRPAAVRHWAGDHAENDDPILVAQIQQQLLPRRGIWVSPDQIMVTLGAQQALYLIAAVLMQRGVTVGVEEPCYPDARNIFSAFKSRLVHLPLDEFGLRPSAAMRKCDYVLVTPSHQNPTTISMPIGRRSELLAAATKYDFVLLEDDYDGELMFSGNANPAIKSLDPNGRVIYIGSLSKTVAPGFRVGYVVAEPELINELRAIRRLSIRHPAANNQRAIGLFMALGYHHGLLKKLIKVYGERAEILSASLREFLPSVSFREPSGGSSLWAAAPRGIRMDEVARKAAERSLLFDAGDIFFAASGSPENFFRLGFSSIPTSDIRAGVAMLAEVLKESSGGRA
jgi:GntR family transcriptional regulator/MocR family aminotransferase